MIWVWTVIIRAWKSRRWGTVGTGKLNTRVTNGSILPRISEIRTLEDHVALDGSEQQTIFTNVVKACIQNKLTRCDNPYELNIRQSKYVLPSYMYFFVYKSNLHIESIAMHKVHRFTCMYKCVVIRNE